MFGMGRTFEIAVIFCLLAQAFAYRTCRIYHSDGRTTDFRCSSSEYCCDHGCCRKVYTIWYFWTLLLFGLFVGIIFCWWYKAYKYRQRGTVVQRNVIPMQVVQPYPPHPPMNSHNHQAVPGYPPYTAYAFAPPPYSVAVDQGTVPPPNYYPPNQEPKQQ